MNERDLEEGGGKDKEGNGKHKGYFWKFLELIF
jgi:hypothetical protein